MTPLAARLRELITENGPQSPDHLRRGLRLKGQNVPADLIEREMRSHSDLFRPTGSGTWDLAENVVAPSMPKVSAVELTVDPLIAGAITDTYVVVDLETTGTEPGRDEIVQVAVG